MSYATTMTQKGQMTIPKSLRQKLNLKKGSRLILDFIGKRQEVRIRPAFDILDVAKSIKVKKKTSPLKARMLLEKIYKR
jgi:AbrB family looped-hinge helix DNA binding protein